MSDLPNPSLSDIVAAHKRGGSVGLYGICSAHPFVLAAAAQQSLHDHSPLLVESTCNQVNQEGGYTGMTPAAFHDYLLDIARRAGLPRGRLILGGDHLGPGPWQDRPAAQAMDRARVLVRDCVRAGYVKLHLDASMSCAGDPPGPPLDKAVSAARTAELCLAAEEAYRAGGGPGAAPCYVIGTEVPPPGGAQEHAGRVAVTTVGAAEETIALTCDAFRRRGLGAAWERTIALVVQPGVEFGADAVQAYDRRAAGALSAFIAGQDRLVYEAHSTDYQSSGALRELVEDHFPLLKVGPALTFAFREAVFALEMIEVEWLSAGGVPLSDLRRILDDAMLANPVHWHKYYTGSEPNLRFQRRYSPSDRSRYYWPEPHVQEALSRLLANLGTAPIPLPLLSQFLPVQHERVRAGLLLNSPRALIHDKIRDVLAAYAAACGYTD